VHSELTVKYNEKLKNDLRKSILTKKLGMSFDDIAGCDYAKEIIKETFILPNMMPHLFKGNARPWQSILIYGPPGVGKTMLA
jgi:SpoVK/Ycf46/Vps4 family AAA+-type ATPase